MSAPQREPEHSRVAKLLRAKRDIFLETARAYAHGAATEQDALDAHHELSIVERITGMQAKGGE